MKEPYSDARWRDDPQFITLMCSYCKHDYGNATCAAFPDGIPREVLSEEFPHTKPYPGDHGIQFEKKEEEYKRYGNYVGRIENINGILKKAAIRRLFVLVEGKNYAGRNHIRAV